MLSNESVNIVVGLKSSEVGIGVGGIVGFKVGTGVGGIVGL